MKNFVFVSGNMYKVAMLERFLDQKVDHHKLDLDELQTLDSHKVVEHKVRQAYAVLQKPVLVDDVSLGFNALNGLPGTFVKMFLDTIGTEGLPKLLMAHKDKSAVANVLFGYYDGKDVKIFEGTVTGTVVESRGDLKALEGHGWNSIFEVEGTGKTFAEMNAAEVAEYSPRAKAVKKLKKFLEEEV